ncbi:MAG TPA: lytic transglycosylase domain-containing protein [Terracidiphilus sp.]
MRRAASIAAISLAVLAVVPQTARAAERVTLSNGFVEQCHHHALVDGRIRLYLSADEDNYIEFAPTDIAAFESIPDPPPPALIAPPGKPTGPAHLTPGDLHEMLTQAGSEHNLDVDLLASVVKAESDGNTRAVSRAGAQGLMQLMPGTAAGLGVKDSFEPNQNVRGGSTYLDALLVKYHDNLALALAAYNAGPEAVDKYHGIPPYRETHLYVARVIHEFNRRVLAREAEARRTAAPEHATAAQPAP